MAVDKLVDSGQLDSDLEDIADAIRAKGGTSAQLAFPNGFVSAIENIPSGGGTTWEQQFSGTVAPENWGDPLYYVAIYNYFTDHDSILNGEKYRITWRNTAYECVVQEELDYYESGETWVIGNATLGGGTTGNNEPFFAAQWNNNLIFATTDNGVSFTLVIEKQVSSGGSTLITKTITANGTYDAEDDDADGYSSVTVNVSGGGGLVYESGTYTPASDTARPTISFTNTHSTMPLFVMMTDATGTYSNTSNTAYACVFYNCYWTGNGMYQDSQNMRYAEVRYIYRSTSATSLSAGSASLTSPPTNTDDSASSYYRYWVTESNFRPYTTSTSRYWRSGRTYKWIAVWAPTT